MSIHVLLLGTAAGGGLPQWNCSCQNCRAARNGGISPSTQSSVAISADGEFWFIVNASPDLGKQVESFPALRPKDAPQRNSPISGVLLTNADLDHVLGLILLREGERLTVLATRAVQETLRDSLGMDSLLDSFCGVEWIDVSNGRTPLLLRNGSPSGLSVNAIALPGGPPRYAKHIKTADGHSVAFQITDERGARLLIAPDVAGLTPELQQAMKESDAVLFDGTFWSGDELCAIDGRGRSAEDMGHLPLRDGGLQALKSTCAPRKILVHINNTNPILAIGSPERAAVVNAGIVIGEDHMEFEL